MDETVMQYVFIINDDGFIVDSDVVNISQRELTPTEIATPFPVERLYKPKWVNGNWTEGATKEEIDEMSKVEPSPPTDTEILGQQMTEREIEAMYQGQQLSDMELRLLALEVM